jgi:hypothetical protein
MWSVINASSKLTDGMATNEAVSSKRSTGSGFGILASSSYQLTLSQYLTTQFRPDAR